MYKSKKVSVVIGTYNEAGSIRSVIQGFFATGVVDEVVVVDNNALGNTREEIEKTKAKRIVEKKQGYGFAYMRGLSEVTGDLIVMTEADGTFEPEDIHKFLLYSDDFSVVFGTRTSRAIIWSDAFMPFPVRFGNWAVAKFLEVIHNGPTLTDVGCTYKLINREINFYRKNKLSIPVMCFNCRHEARMSKRNPRNLWKGICAKCDKEILTSYTPEDQKNYKIYCEKCYQQKIY